MAGAAERVIPVLKKMVIRRDKPLKAGSMYLPDQVKDNSTTGRVINVGPDVTVCKPGDRVLFGPWDGLFCIIDGRVADPFVVMDESCIYAVIKDDPGASQDEETSAGLVKDA